MDIHIKTVEQVTVIEIAGDIDGKTAPEVQQQVLSLVKPGGRILHARNNKTWTLRATYSYA